MSEEVSAEEGDQPGDDVTDLTSGNAGEEDLEPDSREDGQDQLEEVESEDDLVPPSTPFKAPHDSEDLLNGYCVRTPLKPTQYTHEEKMQHR